MAQKLINQVWFLDKNVETDSTGDKLKSDQSVFLKCGNWQQSWKIESHISHNYFLHFSRKHSSSKKEILISFDPQHFFWYYHICEIFFTYFGNTFNHHWISMQKMLLILAATFKNNLW